MDFLKHDFFFTQGDLQLFIGFRQILERNPQLPIQPCIAYCDCRLSGKNLKEAQRVFLELRMDRATVDIDHADDLFRVTNGAQRIVLSSRRKTLFRVSNRSSLIASSMQYDSPVTNTSFKTLSLTSKLLSANDSPVAGASHLKAKLPHTI